MTTRRTGNAEGTMPCRIALELDYLTSDHIAARPPVWWRGVLGVVGFDRPPVVGVGSAPVAASMTPGLGAAAHLCEVWRVSGAAAPVTVDRCGDVVYAEGGDFLFGSVAVDERRFTAGPPAAVDHTREGAPPPGDNEARRLQRATLSAYRDIFRLIAETGHPSLVRIWNYLPEINRDADGDERYRHFNSARQQAFRDSGRAVIGTVPAASALGSPAGSPLSIYFLAARQPAKTIENPRQVSAYHYPSRYGTHSPVFSRACVLGESGGTSLFVSGTASIVGHESIHPGDVAAQARETLINIRLLLDEANRSSRSRRYTPEGLKLKVYVRRPADLPVIAAAVEEAFGPAVQAVYLRADICRSDLLVEIEAAGASEPVRSSSEAMASGRRNSERGAKMLT